jgi:hypothetical protein
MTLPNIGDAVIIDGNTSRVGTVTALNNDPEFPFEVTFRGRDCDIADDFAAHRLTKFVHRIAGGEDTLAALQRIAELRRADNHTNCPHTLGELSGRCWHEDGAS